MSLSHGRSYLAIPGPSVIPDRVLQAMHRPAPEIHGGAMVELLAGLLPDLRAVARTRHKVAMYISNGHGVWEASLANTIARGDRVLALATGRFGHGWAETARGLGAEVEVMDFGKSAAVDPDRVAARLAEDGGHAIRAVTLTHVDTATSVRNDIPALRAALDAAGHPALLMVDCIASLGCDRFEMDDWGVDVMISACQKGLMVPPGMGFVFFGPRAEAARERADCVTPYWDWRMRSEPEVFYQYFWGTAPTHHLYGLRAALDMLVQEEGMEAAWARHERLARAVWAAFDAWGGEGSLALNVADPASRSHAVTSARIDPPNGTALRDWLSETAGVTLGIGLGMAAPGDPAWHGYFRLAHMGHVNAHMVLGALGAIEAGLDALGLPHGPGALEAAARVAAGR
ncbi:alanine-glyoxylate transaminase / serine-glyoxylate transaminase / serine-pyruvate transaminase [Rhodovulum sp. ES.010]|uniref:pyridoxal-phosphate-dependent aminotransferase family protein n=1 Tax=Rhodovulum sp. ES.010 TaxID=1882821 RepID=UPI000926FA90|nr:aminotransferase class V-fold PLP-dependent enzyme [Rhodovulum sp. ES.010]SIO31881.1 alanine-glyoxylate transaminase / serine-glyoxylate transaminase / serine-pyruvate transaminase [Rhodovulum sp. ES.010]